MVSVPALSRDEQIRAMQNCDARFDGRFVVCVKTTGIYCLPSCRVPRQPLPKNVEFVDTFAEARDAGYRACKLCKPDQFELGEDRELTRLEALVERVRRSPGAFDSVASMAAHLGWSASKLGEDCRTHYQSTPGDLLTEARIDRAGLMLRNSDASVGEIAAEVGYDSPAAFSQRFRESRGLSPTDYRQLDSAASFSIALPADFRSDLWLARIARDADGLIERFDGTTYTIAVGEAGLVGELTIRLGQTVHCSCTPGLGFVAHRTALRLLGVRQSPRDFERQASAIGQQRLIEGREGARIPQTASVWDGMIWAILGQQVNLNFARSLRRHLFAAAGRKSPSGLLVTPSPEAVAELAPETLLRAQFSARKVEYLQAAARNFAQLEGIASAKSVTTLRRRLLEQRGIGPWATNYLLMRSLGLPDCLPIGDTGLSTGLQNFLGLDARPDATKQESLAAEFRPYRSWLVYHLWQGFQGKP